MADLAYQPLSDGINASPLLDIGTRKDYLEGLVAQVLFPPLPTWWLLFSNNQCVRRYQGVVTGVAVDVIAVGIVLLVLDKRDGTSSTLVYVAAGILFALAALLLAGVVFVQVRRGTPARAAELARRVEAAEARAVEACTRRMDVTVADRDRVAAQAVKNAKRQVGSRWDIGVGFAVNLWIPPLGLYMAMSKSGRSVSFRFGAAQAWAAWFLLISIAIAMRADLSIDPTPSTRSEKQIALLLFINWVLIQFLSILYYVRQGNLQDRAMQSIRSIAPPSLRA